MRVAIVTHAKARVPYMGRLSETQNDLVWDTFTFEMAAME